MRWALRRASTLVVTVASLVCLACGYYWCHQAQVNSDLLHAVRTDNRKRVEALLNAGANADARESAQLPTAPAPSALWQWLMTLRNPTGQTALQLALGVIHPNRTAVARLLLQHGASARVIDIEGRTLIDCVIETDGSDLDTIGRLLAQGCSATGRQGNLLEIASEWDDVELAQVAIRYCAGLDATQALASATSLRRINMVRFLLQQGSDPDRSNIDGHTPLTIACDHDTYDDVEKYAGRGEFVRATIVQLLLKSGAKPNLRDSHGRTPVECAKKRHDNLTLTLLKSASKFKPHPN